MNGGTMRPDYHSYLYHGVISAVSGGQHPLFSPTNYNVTYYNKDDIISNVK